MLATVLLACAAPSRTVPEVPAHESWEIASRVLAEQRRINVYLPPGYSAADSRLPVLYMPDGGVSEDFPHIARAVDALIRDAAIAPVIVVGIENTQRRRDLTGPTEVAADREIAPVVGGASAFRAFLTDELVHEIERRYRCTGQRALIGESLAGLFVLETFVVAPHLFERCIAVSPSLWWNDGALARGVAAGLQGRVGAAHVLWMTVADEDNIAPWTDLVFAQLTLQATPGFALLFAPMPQHTHETIFRAAAPLALRAALWPPH